MANRTDLVLQSINKKFITLQDDDKKHYMKHYMSVIDELVKLMKRKDDLFKNIFQNFVWAGSYYDGLKVGKPEEYDVDVVMNLPIDYNLVEFINKEVIPPFTKIKMQGMEQLKHHPKWTDVYRQMDGWTDEKGFLLQSKFRIWMESSVNKALNALPKKNNIPELVVNGDTYLILLKKTGPAMTLNITIPGGMKLDVDLVPVLEFKFPKWPPAPVRPNQQCEKRSWFVVPKPNSKIQAEIDDSYWRLAFHEQEREMISNKGQLKPVCRLLKKLRDTQVLKLICSYYIKTIFLWEITKRDESYWRTSLSVQFMDMLKILAEAIKKGRIDYFWDDRYNLLSGMSDLAKSNVEGRLNKIIVDIEKKSVEDPMVMANYLLTKEEFCQLSAEFPRFSELSSSPLPQIISDVGKIALQKPTTAETANDASLLDTVSHMVIAIQKELKQQTALMQTVLAKMNALQDSVDILTCKNTILQDEVNLFKIKSSASLIETKKEENKMSDVDFLLSFISEESEGNG